MPSVASSELMSRMGIEVIAATAERVVATMPVEGNRQVNGLLNGGASCILAESIASIAANLNAGPNHYAVGVDLNATHHRAVNEGTVTGVAIPLHIGRSVATYSVSITDEKNRSVCSARLTVFLRPRQA